MTVPRFYCAIDLVPSSQLRLPESAAHHALKVLRLKRGDRITLFNGGGGEFDASIHQAQREGVVVDVGKYLPVERESALNIRLVQGLSSAERMDFTIQKAVELGVSEIQPLTAERSVVRLSGERAERRLRHWQNVAAAACEQCGRNRIPQVGQLANYAEWMSLSDASPLRVLMSPLASTCLRELPPPTGQVELLAGPEGGLTEFELGLAQKAGFHPIRLGPRVLRTETAALAAISAMQALWGDFSR